MCTATTVSRCPSSTSWSKATHRMHNDSLRPSQPANKPVATWARLSSSTRSKTTKACAYSWLKTVCPASLSNLMATSCRCFPRLALAALSWSWPWPQAVPSWMHSRRSCLSSTPRMDSLRLRVYPGMTPRRQKAGTRKRLPTSTMASRMSSSWPWTSRTTAGTRSAMARSPRPMTTLSQIKTAL